MDDANAPAAPGGDDQAGSDDGDMGRYSVIPGAVELRVNALDDKAHSISFRAERIKTIDGSAYLHMVTANSNIRCLLAHACKHVGKDVFRVVQNTDVMKQIISLRNDNVRELMTRGCHSSGKRFRPNHKMYTSNRMLLPETVTVRAPDICGVPGIDMKVTVTTTRTHALWIEMVAANVKYIANATAAQYSAWVTGGTATDDDEEEQVTDPDVGNVGVADNVPSSEESSQPAASSSTTETPHVEHNTSATHRMSVVELLTNRA